MLIPIDRRRHVAPQHACPWCHGRLTVKVASSLADLIPGGVQTQPDDSLPPEVRWVPAIVCATPHCRYRAVLRPVAPVPAVGLARLV